MNRVVSLLGFGLLFGATSPAGSTTYSNGINDSSWRAQTSVFECRLEHGVPYYGTAVFSTRAGEKSKFYLRAKASRFAAGEAQLLVRAPAWKGGQQERSLGSVPVKRGKRPLWLATGHTEQMLAALNNGNEIELVRQAWYENDDRPALRLAIGTIGFRQEYRRYLSCLAGLLPANFDQLKRTALYFAPAIPGENDGLPAAVARKLDKVLKLVKHDDKIRHFYVDGHASEPGDRTDNLALSKRRAELVAEYLTRGGISADRMTVRWHGERYPAASNGTVAGRAKNRRVTLRMERVEKAEGMPMASNGEAKP